MQRWPEGSDSRAQSRMHAGMHSLIQLSATPWSVAHQAPLSIEFSRQEYWRWVAISYSRGSSWQRDQTSVSSHWRAGSLPLNHLGSPQEEYSLTSNLFHPQSKNLSVCWWLLCQQDLAWHCSWSSATIILEHLATKEVKQGEKCDFRPPFMKPFGRFHSVKVHGACKKSAEAPRKHKLALQSRCCISWSQGKGDLVQRS